MGRSGPHTTEIVRLSGHLDGRCTIELRALLTAHLARHADEDLRLDMSAVESVDLTVLRLLAGVAVRLRRDGHQLVLVGCTPSLRRLLSHGVWRRLFVVQRTTSSGAVAAGPPEQPRG
jgi:anti-anti-sigma factor